MKMSRTISKEEEKVYDRQIRLWGVESQNRMRNTRVLVYGMTGVSCEVLKNIVLSGVGYVCVMDEDNVEEKNLGTQFFVRKDDVGKNISECSYKRIQELNPFVKIAFNTSNIVDVDDKFFDDFDIVFISKCCLDIQEWVNKKCRIKKISFFTADMFGMIGISFQDWGNCFSYSVKMKQKGKDVSVDKEIDFVELSEFYKKCKDWSEFSKPWILSQCLMDFMNRFKKFPDETDEFVKETFNLLKTKKVDIKDYTKELLKRIAMTCNASLSPLCAIFGGIVANEIVKCICKDAEPIKSFFVYDGLETFCGIIESI